MADERRRSVAQGASAARGSDPGRGNILPWLVAALIVAALVIGAVWLLASDDEGDVLPEGTGEGSTPSSLVDEEGEVDLGDDSSGVGTGGDGSEAGTEG